MAGRWQSPDRHALRRDRAAASRAAPRRCAHPAHVFCRTGRLTGTEGKGFAFSKDRGGDEFYQLWWYALETAPLTEHRGRITGLRWARSGERFAYSTTRRNGRDADIHVMDRARRVSRPVLEAEGSWSVLDWSTDDRQLLVQKYLSINQTELWVVPSQGGEARRLHPSEQPIAFGAARFAAGDQVCQKTPFGVVEWPTETFGAYGTGVVWICVHAQ